MQELFDVVKAVVERLGHTGELLRGRPQRITVLRYEALHLAHRNVQIAYGPGDFIGIIGEQTGHRGQVLVELTHQVGAVLQRRHQGRQVLDGRENVGAVIAQCRERLRQLDHGRADIGALTA